MKQLPNILTLLRIVLSMVFVFFVSQGGLFPIILAAIIFFVASLTDYYDGYFAKRKNVVSSFGKIMDPIADKFLVLFAFFIFTQMNFIPFWMFVVILLREIVVTISRLFSASKGRVLSAKKMGKLKTVFQIMTVGFILLFLMLQRSPIGFHWNLDVISRWLFSITALMWVTTILTIVSGIDYFLGDKKITQDMLVKMVSTFFYVGYFPMAPGTIASIFGFVLGVMLNQNIFLYIVLTVVITAIGFYVSDKMEKAEGKKDPSCIVIDEVAGAMIAIFLLPIRMDVLITAFFLFRAFDMFKIYPCNKLEDIEGGAGIMGDDLVAGLYANIIMQVTIRISGLI